MIRNRWGMAAVVLMQAFSGLGAAAVNDRWTVQQQTVGSRPWGVLIGDADQDGNQDILVANSGSNSVSLLTRSTSTWGRQDLAVGAGPSIVALGDVDDDGDLDIVTANEVGNSISILRRNHGQWLREDQAVGKLPWGVAIGDADRDGDQDIVVANQDDDTVSILSWKGSLWGRQDVAAGNWPQGVTFGDADNDGDAEIVVANNQSSGDTGITLLEPDGDAWTTRALEAGNSGIVLVGDVDGDGDNDLVGGDVLSWNGTDWDPPVDLVGGYSGGLVLGDLDDDGDVDIGSTRLRTESLIGLFQLGSTWAGGNVLADIPGAKNLRGLALGDLDGDGDRDLVVADLERDNVTVLYFNGGYWSFGQVSVPWYPDGVAAGDVDNDSDTDIVAANYTLNSVSVLRRQDRSWTNDVLPTGRQPTQVEVGDADGDGDNDVVALNSGSKSVSVHRWDAGQWEPTEAALPGDVFRLALGDADNDGKQDLVVVHKVPASSSQGVSLLHWNGAGWIPQFVDVGPDPRDMDVGDADNDGQNEIVTVHGAEVDILHWDGSVWTRQVPGSLPGGQAVAIGDADNDGANELILATGNSVAVFDWTEKGWTRREAAALLYSPGFVGLADPDADGDLDIVCNGSLLRWKVSNWSVEPIERIGVAVAIGDVDNDGIDDLVAGSRADFIGILRWIPERPGGFAVPAVRTLLPLGFLLCLLFRRRARTRRALARSLPIIASVVCLAGNGVATAQPAVHDTNGWNLESLGTPRGYDVAVGDLDGDGDEDIVTASAYANVDRLIVLLWNGSGWTRSDHPAGNDPRKVAIGDVDNDGDVDIVSSNIGNIGATGNLTFLKRDAGGWINSQLAINDDPTGVAIGDTDGDGINELLYTGYFSQTVSILEPGSDRQDLVVGGSPESLVLADADDDGDLDIITTNYPSSVTILRRNPSGWVRNDVLVDSGPVSAALGDVDNDGHTAIVVAHEYNDEGAMTLIRRVGSAWIPEKLSAVSEIDDAAVGDVDGDGDNDITAVTRDGLVLVLRWSPAKWTIEDLQSGSGFGPALGVAIADVNQDGRKDIVTPDSAFLETGRFWLREDVRLDRDDSPHYFAELGDADNDGYPEILLSEYLGRAVTVLDWAGSQWTQSRLTVGLWPEHPVLGDVDADGDNDIAVVTGAGLELLRWDGSSWTRVDSGWPSATPTFGDADNDGDQDVVLAGDQVAGVRVLRWTGSAWASETLATDVYPRQAMIADVDGDGDRDIVALSDYEPSGLVALRWNRGRWVREDIDLGVERPGPIALGDADNDGEPEILIGSGDSVHVLQWTGSGWAREALSLGAKATDISIADTDGDGDREILTAKTSAGVTVHRWTGVSWSATELVVGARPEDFGVSELVVGDADNDGVVEIVTVNIPLDSDLPDSISVFRRQGDSWQQDLIRVRGSSPHGLAIADVNHDGKKEIFLIGAGPAAVSFLRWFPSAPVSGAVPSIDRGSLLIALVAMTLVGLAKMRGWRQQ